MAGIINWNELWKVRRSGHYQRRAHEEDAGKKLERAKKFSEWAIRDKENAEKQIAPITLKPGYTVLDVGAGTGRLAIPIAKRVKTVTAIDQSKEMLACLQENREKEGITNIVCINKRWEDIALEVDIEPHDVVMACHSLGMFDLQEAVAKMDAAAKKYVYILTSAGRWMDEKHWKELYGESPSTDYIYIYNILHDMKIYANVDIRDAESEQRYESLDDAVTKWKEMRDIPTEKEGVLREHLSKMLVEDDGTGALCLKRKSKIATIWWQKSLLKPEGVESLK